jgi:hypothetical protein
MNGGNTFCTGSSNYGCGGILDESITSFNNSQGYYGLFTHTVNNTPGMTPIFINAGHFETETNYSVSIAEGFAGIGKVNDTATVGNLMGAYLETGSTAGAGKTLTITNAYDIWARHLFGTTATANITNLYGL